MILDATIVTSPVSKRTDSSGPSLRDLFTRDVTQEAMRDLVRRDVSDAWRYFRRDIDRATLQPAAWYSRWTIGLWKTFLAIAFRLSPARRSLLALAVLLLGLSWLRYGLEATLSWFVSPPSWGLLSATVLFLLLVLELRDKLALRGDVEIARQIQMGLLPAAAFQRDGIIVTAAMQPAYLVGGDYFDVVDLDAGRVAVVVADVAGKGIPAALLMALLHGSLRTLIAAGCRGSQLVATLNDHLHANIPSNRLVTLFYGELDTRTACLRYVNAGHNAPFVIRQERLDRLPATGMALGIVPAAIYEDVEVSLAPGDRLLVFTDGVTEALDREEREYGEARLEALLDGARALAAADLVHRVEDDVIAHCGGARQYDDITLLAIARDTAA